MQMINKWRISLMLLLLSFASISAQRAEKKYLSQVGEIDSLFSDLLQETREIYVQFPENYNPEKADKYPLLLVLDGEYMLPLVSTFQDYYSGGFTPDMLIVGISNANNRVRDLTPSKITEKYGMPFKAESGGADNFLKFIGKELIPYLEENYPLTNYRTIVGHSYGGLFTVYSFLEQPDLFANYLVIDPSLDWDDQKLLKKAEKLLAERKHQNKSLFVSMSGQLHMQDASITIENVMEDETDYTIFPRSILAFSKMLEAAEGKGLVVDWKYYPKDLHGTLQFPSVYDGLLSIFEWYQMENTDKINSFDTPQEELKAIVDHRATKLKKHFGYVEAPYPEDLLNMSAYMNMEMGQLDKAEMYFKFAIKYYPNSSNVYDSMADYYIQQKDYKKGLKYLKKAFKISGDQAYEERIEALKKEMKGAAKGRK